MRETVEITQLLATAPRSDVNVLEAVPKLSLCLSWADAFDAGRPFLAAKVPHLRGTEHPCQHKYMHVAWIQLQRLAQLLDAIGPDDPVRLVRVYGELVLVPSCVSGRRRRLRAPCRPAAKCRAEARPHGALPCSAKGREGCLLLLLS